MIAVVAAHPAATRIAAPSQIRRRPTLQLSPIAPGNDHRKLYVIMTAQAMTPLADVSASSRHRPGVHELPQVTSDRASRLHRPTATERIGASSEVQRAG